MAKIPRIRRISAFVCSSVCRFFSLSAVSLPTAPVHSGLCRYWSGRCGRSSVYRSFPRSYSLPSSSSCSTVAVGTRPFHCSSTIPRVDTGSPLSSCRCSSSIIFSRTSSISLRPVWSVCVCGGFPLPCCGSAPCAYMLHGTCPHGFTTRSRTGCNGPVSVRPSSSAISSLPAISYTGIGTVSSVFSMPGGSRRSSSP